MPIEDWIPGISAASSIIGGAIARGQAKRDAAAARSQYLEDRRYNEPYNVLKRIHEAGLPTAAYFTGGANSQSAPAPQTPYETDNGIAGAGMEISKYLSNRLARIQVETAAQNLGIVTNQRKMSDAETKRQLADEGDTGVYDEDGNMVIQDSEMGELPMTYQPHFYKTKKQEEQLLGSNAAIRKFEEKMKGIDFSTYKEMGQNQLNKLIEEATQAAMLTKFQGDEYNFKKHEMEIERMMSDIKHTFFKAINDGEMPSWRKIFSYALMIFDQKTGY